VRALVAKTAARVCTQRSNLCRYQADAVLKSMPVIDTTQLPTTERLPGWKGRVFSTEKMTFAHYEFAAGSTIHEHCHSNEEVWTVLEGELELTIGGDYVQAGLGSVAVVPPNTAHSVRAITNGKAIVADSPVRLDVGGGGRGVVRIDFDSPVSLDAGPSDSIDIPYALYNWGKSRVVVRQVNTKSGLSATLPPPAPTAILDVERPAYCTLDAGGRYSCHISHPELSSMQRSRITSGESVFYVRGAIFYDDTTGARQHTTFCRVYDCNAHDGMGGFVDPKKPGYNYGS